MRRITLAFAIVCYAISPIAAWGLGGDAGGTGGGGGWSSGNYGLGCCGIPAEIEVDAMALRNQFLHEKLETLLDRQILGLLCESYECGNLSEQQASLFLDRMIASAREARQWWAEVWAWLIAAAGVIIAAGSLWISYLALKQSNQNEKEIGELQGQMESPKGEAP